MLMSGQWEWSTGREIWWCRREEAEWLGSACSWVARRVEFTAQGEGWRVGLAWQGGSQRVDGVYGGGWMDVVLGSERERMAEEVLGGWGNRRRFERVQEMGEGMAGEIRYHCWATSRPVETPSHNFKVRAVIMVAFLQSCWADWKQGRNWIWLRLWVLPHVYPNLTEG